MHSVLVAAGTSGILLIGMLVCLESGYRLGRRSQATCEHPYEGVGAIDAAVFGLLALLLGFSFAVGMSRLEYRRELAVKEADAIGTAYMRLDLLPADTQPKLRRLFREYLDARLSVYRNLSDFDLAEREIARADQIQDKIWSAAVEGSESDLGRKSVRILLLKGIRRQIPSLQEACRCLLAIALPTLPLPLREKLPKGKRSELTRSRKGTPCGISPKSIMAMAQSGERYWKPTRTR